MEFTDYAKGIAPFIPYGKTDADLFVSIVGNFIKDAAMDHTSQTLNIDTLTETTYPKEKQNTFTNTEI